jgi:predicted regulator of Ras-like GTPase activity (Roadblock/LC7/MglB family)
VFVIDDSHSRGGDYTPFSEILEEMNREGGFARSVLATSEGLPIASCPMQPDHELASAMIAMLQQAGAETQDHLNLAAVDEVTIRTEDSMRLVCRRIQSGGDWICLCALVPAGSYYRRATNRAVRRITEIIDY